MTQSLPRRLIGREAELEQLRPFVEGVTQGRGGFVLVTGEAGIGKTRFVTAAMDSLLGDPPVTRVVGGCLGELELLPYAPVAETLRAAIAHRGAPDRNRIDPYLLHLLPELDPSRAPSAVESIESGAVRYRIANAACGLLEAWAKTRPMAVVLEDLHWADSATREFVPVLVRRAAAAGVLVIATYRSDEADSDYLRALTDLVRRDGHVVVPLKPLGPIEVGEMISSFFAVNGPVSGEFTHAMHERTNGNPFFVEELLNTLVDGGGIFKKDGVWDRGAFESIEVPGTIRDVILRRVVGLPQELTEMLRAASVLGQRFDVETLARTVDESTDAAVEGVRSLIDKQLLTEARDGLRFRHALTRETIYGGLLQAERTALHRRVAETLEEFFAEDLDAGATALAHHYLISGENRKARTYADRACRRALRLGAAEEAHTHLATMADLARDDHERAGLLRRIGVLDRDLGRLEESVVLLSEAEETYARSGDDRARGATLLDLSTSVLINGYSARALELRRRALTLLEPLGPTGELVLAYRSLGHHHMLSSSNAEASRWSRRAIALGTELGAAEVVNDARIDLASAAFQLGECDAAIEDLRSALNVALESGWDGHAGRAYVNLSYVLILRGLYEEAIDACRGGIELADRTGLQFTGWLIRSNLGEALRFVGEWGDAEGVLTDFVREGRETGSRKYLLVGLCTLAPLRADQGRWEEVRQIHAELWPLCLERDELQHHAPALTSSARALAGLGEIDEAWAQLEFLRDYRRKNTDDNTLLGSTFLVAAELAVSNGDAQRGLEWVTLLADMSSGSPSPDIPLCLTEARGAVEGALGEEGAVDSLRVAAEGWRELGRPFDTGRALRLLGELLLKRGEGSSAVGHLREAAAIFGHLGAAHELKLTRAAMRRAGVTVPRGPHASTRSLPGGLTSRELEVARLVAEGKSNAEVARVLVVSPKTAATHVGHILAKLGFSSRTEIARWVVDTDALAPATADEK